MIHSDAQQLQLIPDAAADDSLELFLASHPTKGRPLHSALLLLLIGALGTLPLVRVPIAVRAPGMLRPAIESREARAAFAGRVAHVVVEIGRTVHAGDPLVLLDDAGAGVELRALAADSGDLARDVADLRGLIAALPRRSRPPAPRAAFASPQRAREYARFRGELTGREATLAHARRAADRARSLHARGFASAAEVEDARYRAREARRARDEVSIRWIDQWQADEVAAARSFRDVLARLAAARARAALGAVTAPVGGTITEFSPLSPGSFVAAGDRVAIIAPDTTLIARVYLAPRDVGLVRAGVPVRFRLVGVSGAGALRGSVERIASDPEVVDGRLSYAARCRIAFPPHSLRLRPGMAVEGHLLVQHRTLFALLRSRTRRAFDPFAG